MADKDRGNVIKPIVRKSRDINRENRRGREKNVWDDMSEYEVLGQ